MFINTSPTGNLLIGFSTSSVVDEKPINDYYKFIYITFEIIKVRYTHAYTSVFPIKNDDVWAPILPRRDPWGK